MKTPINSTDSNRGRLFSINVLTLAAALVMPAATGLAQSFWSGGTSDFNNAASWSGTYIGSSNPNCANDSGSNNVVLIQPGDPVWQHGDTLAGQTAGSSGAYLQTGSTNNTGGGNWMRLGIGTGGTVGYYTLSNGVVNVGGQTHIGENGTGYLEVDGGTYNANGGNPGICAGDGDFGPSTGTLTLNAGTINNMNGPETWFGEANSACTGYLIMNGGTFNANNWFVFGRNGGNGYGTMTGGTINFTGGGQFLVGGGGTGSLIQSGGTINVHNQYLVPQSNGGGSGSGTNILSGTAVLNVHSWLAVGRNSGYGELDISDNASITRDTANDGGSHLDIGASGVGVLNQNGGAITNTANAVYLGENGTGTWNLNSGVAILGAVTVCVNGSATGTLNLNGGLFQTTGINVGSSIGFSTVNFNGGTLQASADNNNFVSGFLQAFVGPGGVVIDSQGYNIGIPQTLQDNGGGSLTKMGTGTLTLGGANTYSGATTVSQGTLIVDTGSFASGNYTVSDNAGFGISVQSQGGQLSVANITLGASTGTSLNIDVGSFGNPATGSAPLNVTGTLTVNGVTTVNIGDTQPQLGQFPLVQYQPGGLAGSGSIVIGSLPVGVMATIVTNGANNSIDLNITGVNQPRWDGQAGGDWDIGLTTNWINIGTGLPTFYTDPSPAVFNDNAAGTTTVNLTTTVSPTSLVVTNNGLPYTFAGTGKIGGSTGLNKQGTSSLAILNTGGNTYTGPTIISGGTLTVTNLADGGSPSPIGAASASPTNLIIGGATFTYAGAPVSANRGFTIGATNSTVDAEGNLALGGRVAATPSSAFTKVGPGQLSLTDGATNEFASGYNPGVQVIDGTLLLDGSAGGQTNHTVNDFYVGCTPATGASLILTNTTLKVDGWFAVGRINGGINNTSTLSLFNSAMTCGNLSIGWDGGKSGNLALQFVTLNGTSTLTNFGAVNLDEGANSTAEMDINDNSVFWVRNPVYISSANNSTDTVVVANSGRFIQTSGWFDIGQGVNGMGAIIMKDNASVSLAGDFNVSDTAAGATALATIQDNATLTANNLWVGKEDGVTAIFTITNNAAVNSHNGLTLATHFDGNARVPAAAILNLGGGSLAVNLVQGSTTSGTNNGTFNFNGGKLISQPTSGYSGQDFMFNLEAINVLSGGAFIEIDGTNINDIHQPLLGGNGDGGLTKLGTGTLYLNAVNTYTNTTTISSGALGGTGTIAGPVTVASGGTLIAGAGSISTFNINNALTFAPGSTSMMKIAPASNDQIAGLTTVSYAGSLVVSNTSASPLVVGHTYTLFNSASAGTGNFSSVTVLPSGTATFNPATGVLTITSVGAGLSFNPVKVSGGNLILTGTGGSAGAGYTLLTTTNVATPNANWTTNTTGTLDGSGAFSNNLPLNVLEPGRYFKVRVP